MHSRNVLPFLLLFWLIAVSTAASANHTIRKKDIARHDASVGSALLDSLGLKLKASLTKRGVKFTDSLIYLKERLAPIIEGGNTQKGIKLNEELRAQATRINSEYFMAYYYFYDGSFKKRQRKLGEAAASLFKAVSLAEKTTTAEEQVKFYWMISRVFFELRDSERMQYYSDKRAALLKKIGNKKIITDLDITLSLIIGGQHYKALSILAEKEKDARMSLPVYAFSVYLFQSHAYYRLGKYALSIDRLKKAAEQETALEKEIPNVSIHRKHGLILTLVAMKDHKKAKAEFEKNIDQIVALMDWDDRREIFEAASKLYEALGDNKKALQYFKRFEAYKDSVNNLATKKLVNEIEIKYQTSLKEKALADQKIQLVEKDYQLQQRERHIKTILGILVVLILCGIIYYLITKNKVQTIQLNQLKSQIHPHFLFNALNSLYALTMNKSDDAPAVVMGISHILRYILYECNGPYVSLEKEMDVIREYIKLEKMRKKDRVEVSINITPNLDDYQIAPLLLLPLVENAYKHGVNKLTDDAWISINAKVVNNRCYFKISNNKPTTSAANAANNKYGNIGLQNIRKRLSILYPQKHKMDILQHEDVFIVDIEVDVTTAPVRQYITA